MYESIANLHKMHIYVLFPVRPLFTIFFLFSFVLYISRDLELSSRRIGLFLIYKKCINNIRKILTHYQLHTYTPSPCICITRLVYIHLIYIYNKCFHLCALIVFNSNNANGEKNIIEISIRL